MHVQQNNFDEVFIERTQRGYALYEGSYCIRGRTTLYTIHIEAVHTIQGDALIEGSRSLEGKIIWIHTNFYKSNFYPCVTDWGKARESLINEKIKQIKVFLIFLSL